MEKTVLNTIEKFNMLKKGDTVTVALSGGADSMALLYVLVSLSKKLDITVNAAHLNHLIRGKEAYRDEQFVRDECKKLGITLFCERADIPAYAAENKISTELAARKVRYAFLKRVSSGATATAHTASDNLETMLFNLARGTALKGLCGIPVKRDNLIRPLIFCTREDIENYCRNQNISYVTDSTNLTDEYMRNRIRHNIIPQLKKINPAVEKAAVRTAEALLCDEEFISACAYEYLRSNILSDNTLSVKDFKKTDRAVAYRVLLNYFKAHHPIIALDNKHINDIYSVCIGGGRTSLPLDMSAVVFDGILSVKNNKQYRENTVFKVDLKLKNNNFFKNTKNVNNLLLKNSLDCDKIIGKSVIRTRMEGDTVKLAGSRYTKTLKKLYNEYRIPLEKRAVLPVIADDEGVIWIYGIGAAKRCAVTENTEKVIQIEVSEI